MAPAAIVALATGLLLGAAPDLFAQRFFPDDPLTRDEDDLPIPLPRRVELSGVYDMLENTLASRRGRIPPAANANTLGEVPDSSWFTNRIGVRPLSIAELVRGPNLTSGPQAPFTVVSAKTQGITPGFAVRDAQREVFFVKVDPREHPHLSSAADVIGTRFFHALGYHVPENHLARIRPADLTVGPDARVTEGGRRRPMVPADLESILGRCPRERDGTIRVVASRRVPGTILGPFEFHRTRGDDGNDIFPHEDRRELRGLKVFCAWLNHDDARSLNTLDAYVGEKGRGHVRHYLFDFGSILGSSSVRPQMPFEGNEHYLDPGPLLRSALTLGIWDRPWRHLRYPDHPEVGRIESTYFRPERWKTLYPNPAFARLRPDDAFWAARIVAAFPEDAIRALVGTGEFDDPAAERYLADTILRRREKVLTHYLGQVNPLDGFRVVDVPGAEERRDGAVLDFVNLGEQLRLGRVDGYEFSWFALDNATGRLTARAERGEARLRSLRLPAADDEYLMVRIRTRSPGFPAWRQAVDVYVRTRPHLEVVGIERED